MVTHRVRICFYRELNDFLPARQRNRLLEQRVDGSPGILDTIQSLGVPHTEVARVEVNRKLVAWNYRLKVGDEIRVWPGTPWGNFRPKFILDVHLGKLAKYLRLFGFDVLYRNDYSDPQIIQLALKTCRVILTRDVGLLKHKEVGKGYWLRQTDPKSQAREILKRFCLYDKGCPFRFCLECNGKLIRVPKKEVFGEVPPRARQYFHDFRRCSYCKKVYWAGSHYEKMQKFIRKMKVKRRNPGGTASVLRPAR